MSITLAPAGELLLYSALSYWNLPHSQHTELQYYHTAHQWFKVCYSLRSGECIDWWRNFTVEEHLVTLWVKCSLFNADIFLISGEFWHSILIIGGDLWIY